MLIHEAELEISKIMRPDFLFALILALAMFVGSIPVSLILSVYPSLSRSTLSTIFWGGCFVFAGLLILAVYVSAGSFSGLGTMPWRKAAAIGSMVFFAVGLVASIRWFWSMGANPEKPITAVVGGNRGSLSAPNPLPVGGKGGTAAATGGALALGGGGGKAGVGRGGDGGSAKAHGAGSVAVGGEGGSGPTAAGTGGRGGRSSAERYYEFVGKPIPREMRGWGVGGHGGDASTPATKGGAGLVKFTYTIAPVSSPPSNLFDLYQRESYADGNVSIEQFDVNPQHGSATKLEVGLGWGQNCEQKQLWIFLRNSSSSMDILQEYLPLIPTSIAKPDIQARAGISDPCIASSVTDGFIPFSNNVTAYHEQAISDADQRHLKEIYASKGLRSVLRGPDYLNQITKNWTAAKMAKFAHYKTRNVYHPGA